MIIPSIDLASGEAVQLIGGREQALAAGDPRPLAERFGRVGHVAVVDLDAALGRGSNADIVKDLLKRAPCRVGGGIRDVATARQWLDAGAEQVVLGTAAIPQILRRLPRERVVAALDAVDGEVVVDGWRTRTGTRIADRMAELRDVVGGFLVTFVEREGRLGGTALDRVPALRDAAGDVPLTIAGGIVDPAEIARLDALGCDAQVGMALYRGDLGLAEGFSAPLRSDRADGLWPTAVVDERGTFLGLVYSSAESLAAAIETGRGVYESRTRGVWEKGATSGSWQELLRVETDCDRDTLRFTVRQMGTGFCHRGTSTCFGAARGLTGLAQTLERRASTPQADRSDGSYTARLLEDRSLLAAKLSEEAAELAAARTRAEVIWEAADVLYFTSVALARSDVRLCEVERELDRRAGRTPAAPETPPGRSKRTATGLRRLAPEDAANLRQGALDDKAVGVARVIVEAVRSDGEAGLRKWAERLGDVNRGEPLVIRRPALDEALRSLDAPSRALLERTAERIRSFATADRAATGNVTTTIAGGRTGTRMTPVGRAGCYAPGGRFPLPSSVLMTAITARVAGVEEVWVASPRPTAATLAAAAVADVDAVLVVGGAQAIAALAYGTESVPACDVIVGPGNRYVTAAKHLVSGVARIDMLAGPSELVVIADATSDPALIAADLLAQAEHDTDALPILLATTDRIADQVDTELTRQLDVLPTAETAGAALANGYTVVTASVAQAVEIANRLAPEHLSLHVADAETWMPRCRQFGALFVGAEAAEVLGDYGAGPNHVLPTGGSARSVGALSVRTFLRSQTWLRIDDPTAAAPLVADAAALATIEGLAGHAAAAQMRHDRPR